jgi:hypothetical protein
MCPLPRLFETTSKLLYILNRSLPEGPEQLLKRLPKRNKET